MVDTAKVKQAAVQPKFSIIQILLLIGAILIFIIVELWDKLSDNVPEIGKVAIYVIFLVASNYLGNGFFRVITSTLDEVVLIIKDRSKTNGQKLNDILNVIVRCAYIAGRYFELLNEEQFTTDPNPKEDEKVS